VLRESVPRGVTVAFTAWLGLLTHPGTSVGQRGSPLIHSIVLRGPNAVRPPVLHQRSSQYWSHWSSTGGHPNRGTVFHPPPPARGFCPHGVAEWAILGNVIHSRTQRMLEMSTFVRTFPQRSRIFGELAFLRLDAPPP